MYRHSRIAAIAGSVAALAIAGCAANSGVAPSAGTTLQQSRTAAPSGSGWISKDGVLYHVPHYMATRQTATRQVQPMILLSYGGGPVLVAPKAYVILWGYGTYGDTDGVGPLLKAYVKKMGGSSHDNIYDQYCETSGGGNVYITNPANQFGGAWTDNRDAVPAHPTDAQVAAEALKGVAHFGYDPNGSYIVATPHGRSSSGFETSWCAYHSTDYSAGRYVSYTNLPYQPDAGSACGASIIGAPHDESAVDEGVTIVEGHEYGESVTDPVPASGWYNNQEGEIGDICAWQNIQNDPFGRKSYTMQPMFSNASQSCVQGM